MALSLPVTPRWRAKHEAERDAWLHTEYRTFLEAVINTPAQVVRTGRRQLNSTTLNGGCLPKMTNGTTQPASPDARGAPTYRGLSLALLGYRSSLD